LEGDPGSGAARLRWGPDKNGAHAKHEADLAVGGKAKPWSVHLSCLSLE
jgi:hypothetical protein